MSSPDSPGEPGATRDRLAALDRGPTTSATHDAAVLNRARSAAAHIQSRTARSPRGGWMLALAASFVLGVALTFLLQQTVLVGSSAAGLTIPASSVVRGDPGAAAIPVEKADPAAWYLYIQELLYEGDREAALHHLQRFNELHPDYVHEP